MTTLEDYGKCIAIQKCPQCGKLFKLFWNDYSYNEKVTYDQIALCIRSCPSGGVYGVTIECPYCDYEEEL